MKKNSFDEIDKILSAQKLSFYYTFDTQSQSILTPSERNIVRYAVPKRVEEFATGRFSAKQALKKLGVADPEILAGSSNEPIWPTGFCGSISHSKNICMAVAAKTEDYLSVGIDVETIHKEISDDAKKIINNQSEVKWLTELDHKNTYQILILSVKETIYKLIFPITQQYFYFDAVTLEKPKLESNIVIAKLNSKLSNRFAKGFEIRIEYYFFDDWVFTFSKL